MLPCDDDATATLRLILHFVHFSASFSIRLSYGQNVIAAGSPVRPAVVRRNFGRSTSAPEQGCTRVGRCNGNLE